MALALIRRASTTLPLPINLRQSPDRETTVAALRLRGWKDQVPSATPSKRFEFASFNEAFGWMSRVGITSGIRRSPSRVDEPLLHRRGDAHDARRRRFIDRDVQMADFMDHAAAVLPKPFK